MELAIVTPRGRALHRARATDVPGIVALESAPGMSRFIGSWPAERHLANLTDPASHYLALHDTVGALEGFAILSAYAPKFRWFELSRIAVREPGDGRGADLLAGTLAYAFDRVAAHRIQLEVYPDNARARRAYARAGFREEGVLRDAVTRDGSWIALVLMALLEDERVPPQASRA